MIPRALLVVGAALLLSSLSRTVAGAATATVHGLGHSSLGGATLTVTGSNFGDRALEVGNIGSSGQDGVTFDLPGSDGLVLRFAAPAQFPSEPIIHRDLAMRTLDGGVPTTVLTSSADQVGPDCLVSSSCPGVSEMRVEIWDGDLLRYSGLHASGTVITISGASVDEPGTDLSASSYRSNCPKCPPGHVMILKRTASSSITVDGALVVGNAVLCVFETQTDPPRYSDALLTCSTGSGGGGGGSGGLALSEEGLCEDPPPGHDIPRAKTAAVHVLSGAVASGNPDGTLSLAPDGSGEDFRVRLNGLPPGVPWEDALLRTAACSMSDDYMTGAGPVSMALQCDVVCDDFSGLPPSVCTSEVAWSLGPLGCDFTISNGVPGGSSGVLLLYGGLEQAFSESPVSLSCDHPPVSLRARCDGGVPTVHFGFTAGHTAVLDGVAVPCDSIVVVLPPGAAAAALGLRDVQLVHPPASPPGRLGHFENGDIPDQNDEVAMPVGVRGPRQSISLDGKRLHVSNIGSSGQDGVEVRLDGVHAIEWGFPDPPPGSSPPGRVRLAFHPCDDGQCAESSVLDIEGLDNALPVAQLDASFAAHGTNPLYVEAGGTISPLHEGDVDGDGRLDLAPTTPDGVQIDRIQCRQWSSRVECETVHFRQAVSMTILGNNFITDEVTVWRNRGGGTAGSDSPEPVIASLSASPPAGSSGVCDLWLELPAVQCAGASVGEPGTSSSVDGNPVVPTWARTAGNVVVSDLDRDGLMDIVVLRPASRVTGLEASGSLEADFRSAIPLGLLAQCDLPALEGLDHAVDVELQLDATRSGATALVWDVTASTGGGSSSLSARVVDGGNNLNWDFQGGGLLQASSSGEGPFGVSSPPSSFEFVGDLDGDGIPDLRCSGFPPGSECVVGGVSYPCDEVLVHSSGAQPVSGLERGRAKVHGLHRGDHLSAVRLAEIGEAPVTAVTPVGGAVAALAVAAPVPNPSLEGAAIRLSIARAGHVRAWVLDLAGRRVARLADATFTAGEHVLSWNGRLDGGAAAPAGLYFVSVVHDDAPARTVRLTLLR